MTDWKEELKKIMEENTQSDGQGYGFDGEEEVITYVEKLISSVEQRAREETGTRFKRILDEICQNNFGMSFRHMVSMRQPRRDVIPLELIEAALSGNEEAMEEIQVKYQVVSQKEEK